MATLRIYIFAFLLTFLSAGSVFAQSVEAQIKKIRKEFQAINTDKTFTEVVLQNEEFLKDLPDGGGTLTGYFKNGEIRKIVSWVGLSNGIQIWEYYFKNGELIFVYEVFKKYKFDEVKSEFDYSKTKEEYGTRYYFNNKQLIDFKTFGKTREETESADEILREVSELLKLIITKHK